MSISDFRPAIELCSAARATRQFPVPKPSNFAARIGLRYERRIGKELALHIASEHIDRVEHNPWFTFTDKYGSGNCCPDFIFWLQNVIVIVEVKLTWTEVAMRKLMELYCPVVATAFQCGVVPLVICRNLTLDAPAAKFSITDALSAELHLLHWPSIGHIQW